jgi:hypothetical protein
MAVNLAAKPLAEEHDHLRFILPPTESDARPTHRASISDNLDLHGSYAYKQHGPMDVKGGNELTVDEVRAMRPRLRSKITPQHLDIILQTGELWHRAIHVPGDLEIAGDLDLAESKIQVLVVDGNLTVSGRLRDREDEEIESLILVGGDLKARDLLTFGTLEVHGDVTVAENLVLLDNSCISHIEGNLQAKFAINQYHHCQVKGEVRIEILVQDAARIECSQPLQYCELDGEAVAGVLNHELIEGEEDEDSEFGLYVDCVDMQAVTEWICEGKSVLRTKGR